MEPPARPTSVPLSIDVSHRQASVASVSEVTPAASTVTASTTTTTPVLANGSPLLLRRERLPSAPSQPFDRQMQRAAEVSEGNVRKLSADFGSQDDSWLHYGDHEGAARFRYPFRRKSTKRFSTIFSPLTIDSTPDRRSSLLPPHYLSPAVSGSSSAAYNYPLFSLGTSPISGPDPSAAGSATSSGSGTHRKSKVFSPSPFLRRSSASSLAESSSSTLLTRSLSDGDLSDYLRGFSALKDSLSYAKEVCDAEILEIIEALHDQMEENPNSTVLAHLEPSSDEDERQAPTSPSPASSSSLAASLTASLSKERTMEHNVAFALTRLVEIGKRIQEMTLAHLQRPGACKAVIDSILDLQNSWKASWPYKAYCAKMLIAFSNVTRLVEHIESDTRMYNPTHPFDPQKRHATSSWRIHIDSPAFPSRPQPIKEVPSGNDLSTPSLPPTTTTAQATADTVEAPKAAMPQTLLTPPQPSAGKRSKERLPNHLYPASSEKSTINILMEWTLQGHIQYISPACDQLLGYTSLLLFLTHHEDLKGMVVGTPRKC